jgi:hypothetical protein
VPRRDLDIPEPTEEWVEDVFGDVTKSRAEAYRMALAFAKREWELQDKRAESDG